MCVSVLPGIVESLLMLAARQAIGMPVVTIFELLGLTVGGLLAAAWLSLSCTGTLSRPGMVRAAGGLLWMFGLGGGVKYLLNWFDGFAFERLADIYWIAPLVTVLVAIVTTLILNLVLQRTLCAMTGCGKLTLQRFGLTLLWMAGVLLGPEAVYTIAALPALPIPLSFVSTVSVNLLAVLLQALCVRGLVRAMLNGMTRGPGFVPMPGAQMPGMPMTASPMTAPPAAKHDTSTLSLIAAAALVAVLLGVELFSPLLSGPVDAIAENVLRDINLGSTYLAAGDLDMAVLLLDRASAHAEGWLAFADDSEEGIAKLRTLQQTDPSDEQLAYLLAVRAWTVDGLERSVLTQRTSSSWYLTLLAAYRTLETDEDVELTDRQEAIRRDLLMACIAAECFVNDAVTLEDVEDREKEIRNAMEPYTEFIAYYGALRTMRDVGATGGMNPDIMERLLQHAEANPDNLVSQYLAYAAGSTWLMDGATHYDRTAEAAIRFGKLFREQEDLSEELEIGILMEVANALMAVQHYADAVDMLEKAVDLGAEGDIRLLEAQCYDALGDNEKCFEMAQEALEDDEASIQAMQLGMVSGLKSGRVTEAMEMAARLTDMLRTLEGDAFLEADAGLYLFVQYLTVQDETQWTPQMKYRVYPDLDAEQQKILDGNETFGDYVRTLHFTFWQRDQEQALQYATALQKALPQSAQVQYLVGTVRFNRREFPESAEAYKASLDIDPDAPTVWFALANAYDAMGEYQEAYDCTLKVAEMLELSNHAVDLYGVQYHNNALMNGLLPKLDQGGAN